MKIFKRQEKLDKDQIQINVGFYWKIILYVVFSLILIALVFGLYVFKQVSEKLVFPVENTSVGVNLIDQSRVQKVLEYFSEKEKKSTEIINSQFSIVDPSL